MTDGYDRAVMFEMLRLIASNPSYFFGSIQYSPEGGGGKKWEEISLMRYVRMNRPLAEEEQKIVGRLQHVVTVSKSRELTKSLFKVKSIFDVHF